MLDNRMGEYMNQKINLKRKNIKNFIILLILAGFATSYIHTAQNPNPNESLWSRTKRTFGFSEKKLETPKPPTSSTSAQRPQLFKQPRPQTRATATIIATPTQKQGWLQTLRDRFSSAKTRAGESLNSLKTSIGFSKEKLKVQPEIEKAKPSKPKWETADPDLEAWHQEQAEAGKLWKKEKSGIPEGAGSEWD